MENNIETLVNHQQIKELNDVLNDLSKEITDQVLKYYKIKNISELKESDFLPTLKRLQEMRKWQKG